MRLLVSMAAACVAFGPIAATGGTNPAWEAWQSVPGVFDLGGPRSDGSMVVAGSAALYLVDAAGNLTPFARGANGYHEDAGLEAYLAVSPGGSVAAAGCNFVRDETFVLRLHKPVGLERIDALGESTTSFANVGSVSSMNGIVFDSTGAFDHRLLVSGPSGSKTAIEAIDCNGGVQVITTSAPVLEGGLAVVPTSFGQFAGDLIGPDEVTGVIWAIAPTGEVTKVVDSGLPKGGDIGVESVAFVPRGFMQAGGYLYYADRETPNNPHPGTDHVLRLSSADLITAGVQDGDMLAVTEGGASMIDIRCDPVICQAFTVIATPTTAHGEGHIVFTIIKTAASPIPSPSPSPKATASSSSQPTGVVIALAVLILLMLVVASSMLAARRRR